MNWLIRLGQWWEHRRAIRLDDLKYQWDQTVKICKALNDDMEALKSSSQIPAIVSKELATINARLNRIELLVGLKRDPQPISVNGAAKIS